MNRFVCGPIIGAETAEAALAEVTPEVVLLEIMATSDTTVCINKAPAVSTSLLTWTLPIGVMVFIVFGYFLGRSDRSLIKASKEEEDTKAEYEEVKKVYEV